LFFGEKLISLGNSELSPRISPSSPRKYVFRIF
jgi:hypothetical protein